MMLPLIGFVAIGLLLVAGRLFFMSDFGSNGASLPVMMPSRERPAEARERVEPEVKKVPPIKAPSAGAFSASARAGGTARVALAVPDVLAVPYEGKKASVPAKRRTPPVSPPKAANKTAVKAPSRPQTVSASSNQKPSGWMVQVGAFSTKSAADDVARRLMKEKRSVTVVSGKTRHRVLLRAGSGGEASALAAQMDRSGFPGSFVISPK
jgi:cell division septation protein DedD